MNANAFRHFYEYHFSQNRKIWEQVALLSQQEYTRYTNYSYGSARDLIVHMINVDKSWFTGLRGEEAPEWMAPGEIEERSQLRLYWDEVEGQMRAYLAGLTDDQLNGKPFPPGEDENLLAWQVLLHVVNHGTDHRAQLLRILHDMGVNTVSQDYIFYVYDNP